MAAAKKLLAEKTCTVGELQGYFKVMGMLAGMMGGGGGVSGRERNGGRCRRRPFPRWERPGPKRPGEDEERSKVTSGTAPVPLHSTTYLPTSRIFSPLRADESRRRKIRAA
ncbi:MAG: hypothetical protein ACLRZZ_30155 [Enterocloster sp.]